LSAGTAGTNYKGGVSFAANSFTKGDIIRIITWGYYMNTGMAVASGRVRLYFNPTGALIGPISDTGAVVGLTPTAAGVTIEWRYIAYITIRTTGAGGTAWCETSLEDVANPANFDSMPGGGGFNIDTTKANSLELTGDMPALCTFTLNQCSIEYLPTP